MTTLHQRELERYRSLMEVPSTFEEGFSWTALAGAIFVALLMVPGAMYMQLLAGQGVGPAAQWVTVILFIEVARRAHRTLRRPEIFVLFYMAGAVMVQPFSGLLYNQFFAQSQSATGMGVVEKLPAWFAPTDPDILARRSFFDPAWYPAIGLVVFSTIMGRLNTAFLSYGLFRVASDVEKLPFPMAPIGAQGIMALAEQQAEESGKQAAQQTGNWRWRVFSVGGVLGLSFGAIYMAVPAISSALLEEPISILPIPFTDWTKKTSTLLPAVATGMSLDMGQLIIGMVLPFFAMVGSFTGLVIMLIANPIMYRLDILQTWDPSQDTIQTMFSNQMDFYFSFGIGLAIAVAMAGIWQIIRSIRARGRQRGKDPSAPAGAATTGPPPGRGDIRTPFIIGVYLLTSLSYIVVSGWLINWHRGVMTVLVFFAFLYTPLISYVTARLEGMAGQVVQIPMVREAAFILSGYEGGVSVWFLPIPLADYGGHTVFYRQAELTGTRFWSVWKAELLLVPIVLLSAILFAQFIWGLAPIPGPEYPFAERMWELNAANQSIIYTSTLGRFSKFQEALRWQYLAAGTGFGLGAFTLLSWFGLPTMILYGLIRGLNQTLPHVILPQFIGAMLGRFYLERKMGPQWRRYIPVVAAGFACGMGLITVLGVGVNFLSKAVIRLPI